MVFLYYFSHNFAQFKTRNLDCKKQKMPHFRIETNVPKSKIPEDFVTKAVPILAKSLGKPEQVN